ncbi:hypothetical protein EDB19DRAFT_1911523 [Suillus lakei]|nr:hypothetical protein EDB19DRAFT_1911523 [Suillus lakei]
MDADQRLAPHRHSEFWFGDGNIVFRASNTLFCVHRGVLVRHSPALEAILAMPSGYDTDGTEQLPIVLHQISEEDFTYFTYFLSWVYHISSVPPPPEEQLLVTILKVSHLWMISNSTKFAIDGLENLTLQPTRRLELAQLYSIPQWIAPAIHEIIPMSLVNTTNTEAAQMGFKVYIIIAWAKEVIERERQGISCLPTLTPCFTIFQLLSFRCKEAWSGFWWKKVAHAILHPTNPLPLTQTLQLIIEAPLPDGMNVACRQAMIDAMIELDGLEVEERIIEGVIRAVTLHFSSL